MLKILPLLATTLLLLSGCATTVSAIRVNPIEQDEGSRTLGTWVNDQSIETIVAVNISKSHADMAHATIGVVSFNGYVLLTGKVPSERMKTLAQETAHQVHHVRRVFNELTVSNENSVLSRSRDALVTASVKTRMITTHGFPADRIKIVTDNGVVYLLGLVTPEEADQAVEITVGTAGVQEIVKIFEYIS